MGYAAQGRTTLAPWTDGCGPMRVSYEKQALDMRAQAFWPCIVRSLQNRYGEAMGFLMLRGACLHLFVRSFGGERYA